MTGSDTEDIFQGLCSSAAVQTCQTYDLSLSYIKRYILQQGILRGQVFYLQRYLARRIGFRRELVGQLTAYHQTDNFIGSQLT